MTNRYICLTQAIEDLVVNDIGFVVQILDSNTLEVEFLRTQRKYQILINMCFEFSIDRTGDRFDKKVCDRCYRLLDTDFFQNNRLKKGDVMTKRPSCIDCRKIKDGISISTSVRATWDQKKPPIGSIFKCPICHKDSIVGITKVILDHNHSTGEVRGWICESCNTGIGRFDDHPEILRNAIRWLERN